MSGTEATRAALGERISYAQVWEDPEVLLSALQIVPGDRVLSICSAGDNAFALAAAGAHVVAIDLSAPQLALAELKLQAAVHLDLAQFRSFLGLEGLGQRVHLYHGLREHLSPMTREWWDGHEAEIRTGLLNCGRFEHYLRTFRTKALPLVHRRKTVEALLSPKSLDAQQHFFEKHWNTRRWRALFRLFFSQFVMARSGRSPAQFAQVDGPVSAEFMRRAEHVLTKIPIATNPFVQWIMRGEYPDMEQAHPYLSEAGHGLLRAAAGRIEFVHADLVSHLSSQQAGTYQAYNLSNVPEYLSEEEHEALLEAVIAAASPGARLAYWNLLVPRHRPASLAGRLQRHPERAAALLRADRAFVYGGFQLETVS
jgi:S-adenosylmethionine-diacylglycerol 3-amino-3-carboxypropyl transferase